MRKMRLGTYPLLGVASATPRRGYYPFRAPLALALGSIGPMVQRSLFTDCLPGSRVLMRATYKHDHPWCKKGKGHEQVSLSCPQSVVDGRSLPFPIASLSPSRLQHKNFQLSPPVLSLA
jgi:hypothetical protein